MASGLVAALTGSAGTGGEVARRAPALGGWIRWSPLLGVAAILAYALGGDLNDTSRLSVLATGLAVWAAASAIGALAGFLFGLPRVVNVAGASPLEGVMATNTNLEEISDWLTKILVGIGLVQLGAFVTRLSAIGDSIAPALGGRPGADAFATSLVVYCLVDGFLVAYLWTRIVVSVRLLEVQRMLRATGAVLSRDLPPSPPSLPPPPPATLGMGGLEVELDGGDGRLDDTVEPTPDQG